LAGEPIAPNERPIVAMLTLLTFGEEAKLDPDEGSVQVLSRARALSKPLMKSKGIGVSFLLNSGEENENSLDVGAVHAHERIVATEHVGDLESGCKGHFLVLDNDLATLEDGSGRLAKTVLVELQEAGDAVVDDLALGSRDDGVLGSGGSSLRRSDVEVHEIAQTIDVRLLGTERKREMIVDDQHGVRTRKGAQHSQDDLLDYLGPLLAVASVLLLV
jgi:hypothetical protein